MKSLGLNADRQIDKLRTNLKPNDSIDAMDQQFHGVAAPLR